MCSPYTPTAARPGALQADAARHPRRTVHPASIPPRTPRAGHLGPLRNRQTVGAPRIRTGRRWSGRPLLAPPPRDGCRGFVRPEAEPASQAAVKHARGAELAGMDGNRTHLGRLSTAHGRFEDGAGASGRVQAAVPGAAGEWAAVRAGPAPSWRSGAVWHTDGTRGGPPHQGGRPHGITVNPVKIGGLLGSSATCANIGSMLRRDRILALLMSGDPVYHGGDGRVPE